MADPELHFIVSAPRSGSTWLSHALNQHPEIYATEQRLFGDFCEIWQNNNGSTSPRITFDSYAKAFSGHYFHEPLGLDRASFQKSFQKSFANFLVGFATRRCGKQFVFDKVTPYPATADKVVTKIRGLFPQAKIVQLVRDGRDVLTSGTFDWLLKDAQGTDRYRYFVDREPGFVLNRFFDDDVIHKWASNWKETIEAFEDSPADLRISYEAMKGDLEGELKKIAALVGADPIGLDSLTKVTFEQIAGREAGDDSQPTAKARKGVVGDWKEHFTRADAELFHSIAGGHLVSLGYEANAKWVEACPAQLGLQNPQKS